MKDLSVKLGDMVYFFAARFWVAGASEVAPVPAVVTAIHGELNVSLTAFPPPGRSPVSVASVPHLNHYEEDYRQPDQPVDLNGFWIHHDHYIAKRKPAASAAEATT